jgi:hypothetical protein
MQGRLPLRLLGHSPQYRGFHAAACSRYVPRVPILELYDLVISRELTLALRLTPMIDGFAVRIQVGSYQGPCPRFEKHFIAGTPVAEAVDAMARYPLNFFNMGRGGVPQR